MPTIHRYQNYRCTGCGFESSRILPLRTCPRCHGTVIETLPPRKLPRSDGDAPKLTLTVTAEERAALLTLAAGLGYNDPHRPGVPSISALLRAIANGELRIEIAVKEAAGR